MNREGTKVKADRLAQGIKSLKVYTYAHRLKDMSVLTNMTKKTSTSLSPQRISRRKPTNLHGILEKVFSMTN